MRRINHRRRPDADTLRVGTAVSGEEFLRHRRAKISHIQSGAGSCIKRLHRIILRGNIQNVVLAAGDGHPRYQQRLRVDLFVEADSCWNG